MSKDLSFKEQYKWYKYEIAYLLVMLVGYSIWLILVATSKYPNIKDLAIISGILAWTIGLTVVWYRKMKKAKRYIVFDDFLKEVK